eukprot:SAG31_NODE_5536_length_2470_cov_2.418389_1_plen_141_part_00
MTFHLTCLVALLQQSQPGLHSRYRVALKLAPKHITAKAHLVHLRHLESRGFVLEIGLTLPTIQRVSTVAASAWGARAQTQTSSASTHLSLDEKFGIRLKCPLPRRRGCALIFTMIENDGCLDLEFGLPLLLEHFDFAATI